MKEAQVYDTTLRDGCQADKISLSVDDKLRIARRLDEMGFDYIEGGWPHPKNEADTAFFERAAQLEFEHARLAAFGCTSRKGVPADCDEQLRALLKSGVSVVTIFGKAWNLHVTDVLRASLDENLRMIGDSVKFLVSEGVEVIFDAEHFFDGWKADRDYTISCLRAACENGASTIVLCDTNGGNLPWDIEEAVGWVVQESEYINIGIHCHNDSGLAVANTLAAVRAGATHVQGTINGYGERSGNANLCTLIPDLELKMDIRALPEGRLSELTELSRWFDRVAMVEPDAGAPYVGSSAFAHKGGMHVAAVEKNPKTFEHVEPSTVGNSRRVVSSEYAGSAVIRDRLRRYGLEADGDQVQEILVRVKEQESRGYKYESADASLELLMRSVLSGHHPALFDLGGFRVITGKHQEDEVPFAEATVQLSIADTNVHTASTGDGPVDALFLALTKGLKSVYPEVSDLELTDYGVISLEMGAGSAVRVTVEFSTGGNRWWTVGAHENIIEASWQAVTEAITYGLVHVLGVEPRHG